MSLARWYRLLLLAYPRRFRRARGTEMLTTLLDAAGPDQRRPRWRDAVNVLWRGLRCRFAVPRGAAYVTAAVVCALFGGLLLAAGVVWASWLGRPRIPEPATAAAVARIAAPAWPSSIVVHDEKFSGPYTGADDPYRAPHGFEPNPGWVQVTVPGTVADARSRLAADGWEVGELTNLVFWAAKSDHVIQVSTVDSTVLMIDVYRRVPPWLGSAVAVGAVVGTAGGWLLAGRALRGFRRHRLGGRAAMLTFGVPGLIGAMVPVCYAAANVILATVGDGWRATNVHYLIGATVPFAVPAGPALLCAGALAVVAPRTPPAEPVLEPVPSRAWRYLAWTATTAHLAFAAGWVIVVAIYLVLRSRVGDGFLGDPKDVVPWGHDALTLLYVLGFLLSPALLAVSVPLLVTGRRRVGVTWTLLLVAAATAVVLPVLMFSPLGQSAGVWWMD